MDVTAATRARIKSTGEELLEHASELGETISRTANEALKDSRRALGKLQDAAEDVVDDTKRDIRKHPFESVAIAVAFGAAIGVFIGYSLGRRR